ncbi:hypothetical protein CIG75_12420 [Tumebacillus algifaecis]|uniref:Uncharacterized protein n=1 Tax=Tumebacillus algifaecis TaxID=1214604 RepID=A0A223D1V1_9BACL|nr:hypothetical protein [Tumebacillus algifaecis]ASS75709.1 hypothetical protein CIG75_12420 [Tumebacillus algifaecis]
MLTMISQLHIKSLEQSLYRLQLASFELEGVTNLLLQGPSEMRRHGLRLQQVLTRYREELQRIEYVTEQGDRPPKSRELLEIGLNVQEAINEISQI